MAQSTLRDYSIQEINFKFNHYAVEKTLSFETLTFHISIQDSQGMSYEVLNFENFQGAKSISNIDFILSSKTR